MKLPFKKYTVMSNNLIQKLGCADVYRTYVLLLIADKYTLTTDTTIDELASFVGDKPANYKGCLLYTSPSPRDGLISRMPSSA